MSEEAENNNIFLTPAVMVRDKLISAGRGISEKEIEKAVEQGMKKQE
jgi:hypothetical protein